MMTLNQRFFSLIGNCFEEWNRCLWSLEESTSPHLHAVLLLSRDQSWGGSEWGEAFCPGGRPVYIQVSENTPDLKEKTARLSLHPDKSGIIIKRAGSDWQEQNLNPPQKAISWKTGVKWNTRDKIAESLTVQQGTRAKVIGWKRGREIQNLKRNTSKTEITKGHWHSARVLTQVGDVWWHVLLWQSQEPRTQMTR